MNTKYVAITGVSAGIGEATASLLLEGGHRVVGGSRRQPCAALLSHPNFLWQKLDVTDPQACLHFFEVTESYFAGLGSSCDVLINNAGLALGADPLVRSQEEDWQTVIDTNITGVLRLTKLFLPKMLDLKRGHLVMLGSIAGHQTYAGGAVYCGSKHMLRAVSQSLREEILGTGVRISTISPGMVETSFSKVRFANEDKARAVYQGMTPLEAMDIAKCIEFVMAAPPHVNIDEILLTPTDQANVHKVHRQDL